MRSRDHDVMFCRLGNCQRIILAIVTFNSFAAFVTLLNMGRAGVEQNLKYKDLEWSQLYVAPVTDTTRPTTTLHPKDKLVCPMMTSSVSREQYVAKCLFNMPTYTLEDDLISEETIIYQNVTFPKPHFITGEHERLFMNHHKNHELVFQGVPLESLTGKIHLVKNGSISGGEDCGWKSTRDQVKVDRGVTVTNHHELLIPLVVPDGWAFQHFLDGVLPKLMQVYHLLKIPGIKIMFGRVMRDSIINEILEKIGITKDMIIHEPMRSTVHSADTLIFACNAPGVHPILWQLGRRRMGAKEQLPVDLNQSSIVLLTRAFSKNGGRHLVNKDAVTQLLKKRYGKQFTLFKGKYNLNQTIELFGRTRILIGVHGGALYNLNFMPSGSHIIEIMPVKDETGHIGSGLAHQIIWMQANLLNQSYWRMSERSISSNGDVKINTTQLLMTLDKIDRMQACEMALDRNKYLQTHKRMYMEINRFQCEYYGQNYADKQD